VIDLSRLKRIVHEKVISKCDHANLNLDVDFLQGILPSTENMAIAFWQELESAISRGRLYCVRLHETDNNTAEYYGE
jgi:6-pyruvoyltetrahydropterin/6-carboxytetrahydropterin synthase